MLGNCATGSVKITIPPTITVRMAMTIATIGRLMKNFAMESVGLAARGVRFRGYDHAITHCLRSLGHDLIARLQTVINDPHAPLSFSHLNRADGDRIARLKDRQLVASLEFGHRAL